MIIVGLTGSIGMGKTTLLEMLQKRGVPTFDADAAVHKLYEGRATPLIEEAFPGTTSDGIVDRKKLSAALMDNKEAIKQLEDIIHPLVWEERKAYLMQLAETGTSFVVLDIPLLFEINADKEVDFIVVASAPSEIQKKRVLARPNMSEEKLNYILSRQLPDKQKREQADYIVETGGDFAETEAALDKLIEILKSGSVPNGAFEKLTAKGRE